MNKNAFSVLKASSYPQSCSAEGQAAEESLVEEEETKNYVSAM